MPGTFKRSSLRRHVATPELKYVKYLYFSVV